MSTFGRVVRVTTFGESHGEMVGCILEGIPPNTTVSEEKIQHHLNRRKPGQSSITTPRQEQDIVRVLSGIQNGVTLGTPVGLCVRNMDTRPEDYSRMREIPRPGHADVTYLYKYGVKSDSGGGRASARETVGRVLAGAVALQYLETLGIKLVAWVHSVGNISAPEELEVTSAEQVEEQGTLFIGKDKVVYKSSEAYFDENQNQVCNFEPAETVFVRCPHQPTAVKMAKSIREAKAEGDSLGGVVRCKVYGVPPGLGEPCFDKFEALLAHAMLSIPATKGFEIGSGFQGTTMRGSQHNDLYMNTPNGLRPTTNRAGGVLGGISSGAEIDFKVAFKPVSTISIPQETVNWEGKQTVLEARGRHDPCVLPRAVPIVEAMAAIVVADLFLLQKLKY